LQGLVDAHTSVPTAVTVLTSNVADPTGYGRIVRNREGEVVAIVEQKDADEKTLAITEVNSGVFAFDADVLRQALGQLDANNAQGELYLTDVLSIARSSGHPVRGFRIADAQEIAGVNDRVQLAEAARECPRRRSVFRASRADVVLSNTATIPWWPVAASAAGIPVLAHVHEAEDTQRRIIRAGLNAPLLAASRIVANSGAARDALLDAQPRLASRTEVVHNGVAGPGRPLEPLRSRRPGDSFRIAMVGRLSPRKGVDVALDAVGLLRRSGVDASLSVCGSVFPGYEWYEAELRERADAQNAPTVEGVTLSSLHAAKGLEWDAVILAGVCEGLLPISLAEGQAAIEEERRLLYVGVTRAREHLIISYARARNAGGRASRKPSRFLDGLWPTGHGSRDASRHQGRQSAKERSRQSAADFEANNDPRTIALFEELRAWRSQIAKERSRPAYTVFADATLRDIAVVKPTSLPQLSLIRGVGATKLQEYGGPVLALLRDFEAGD